MKLNILIIGMLAIAFIHNSIAQTTGTGGYNNGVGLGQSSNQSFTPNGYNTGTPTEGTPQTDDERWVFWIHGLTGDVGSWAKASAVSSEKGLTPLFDARKLKGYIVEYADVEDDGDLLDGGSYVRNTHMEPIRADQLNGGEDPTQNILIGHSQGGLIARAIAHLDLCLNNKDPEDMTFGGIVTFGTPHQGAILLNNKHQFFDLAEDLCVNLKAGPIAENSILTLKIWIFDIDINLSGFLKGLTDKICESFTQQIFPLLTAAQTPFMSDSYKVGASQLAQINGCESQDLENMPKVAFFGVEQKDGLMLRTVHFLGNHVGTEYFDGDQDDDLIKKFRENQLLYASKVEEYYAKYKFYDYQYKSNNCHTFFAQFSSFCNQIRERRDFNENCWNEFKKGVEVLSRMDDTYKKIIGALVIEKTSKAYCVCKNRRTGEKTRTEMSPNEDCISQGPDWTCKIETIYTYSRVEKDSDGVVLAETAANMPGGITSGPTRKMPLSSHMQMRNDPNTDVKLTDLYDGKYDDFFYTEKK